MPSIHRPTSFVLEGKMKSTFILFIVLALLSIGVYRTTRAVRMQTQNTPAKVNKEAEREAARRIRRGLGGQRKTIPDEVLQARGDIIKQLEVGLPVLVPNSSPFNAQTYLAERACAADAIFIGTVRDQKGQLTEDQTFVFSNYKIFVDTIIKNNGETGLSPLTTVEVSRLGGEIQIHGHRVKAISQAAQPLEVGNRYLLFVTFLPEKNNFASNNLAFLLRGKDIVRLTADVQSEALGRGKDADSFISDVQAAALSPCKPDGSAQ